MKNEVRDVLSSDSHTMEVDQLHYLKTCRRVLSRNSNVKFLPQYPVKVCKQYQLLCLLGDAENSE